MIVACERCERVYDDAGQWTLCPHNPLDVGPEPEAFCWHCDLRTGGQPCPCGRPPKYPLQDNVIIHPSYVAPEQARPYDQALPYFTMFDLSRIRRPRAPLEVAFALCAVAAAASVGLAIRLEPLPSVAAVLFVSAAFAFRSLLDR